MDTEILNRILLGITLAAPIGPVSIEMIQRGLRSGFLPAFMIRAGAAVGNLFCLIVSYYGILQLNKNQFFIIGLSIIASLLLIQRGFSYVASKVNVLNLQSIETNGNGMLVGLYLSIANPIAFVFWSGIMANSANSLDTGLAFNLLIIVGVLVWGLVFSLILSFGKNYVNTQTLLYVNKVAGLIMIYYGIKFFWSNLSKIIF